MIKEIIITGGACSGKSTLIERLKEELADEWNVLVASEMASQWMEAGVKLGQASEDINRLQVKLIEHMVQRRKNMRAIASMNDGPTVILYDRAECDNYAFLTDPRLFWSILEDLRLNLQDVLWSYDGVVMLQTAALGASAHFNNSTNPHRWSSKKDAVAEQHKLNDIYITHAHLRYVDNFFAGFNYKIDQAVKEVKYLLSDKEIERKYLVKNSLVHPVVCYPHFLSDIHATYINSGTRYTKRTYRVADSVHNSYRHTVKSENNLLREEIDRHVSAYEYQNTTPYWQEEGRYLEKLRTAFIYHGKLWEMDEFSYPTDDITIVEVETATQHEEPILPPFFELIKEVTGDPEYSSWNLAKSTQSDGPRRSRSSLGADV